MNRKEFYNTLSEDVKTKIKVCQTEEEMLRVLAEEKIALDPELLDSVSGGRAGDGQPMRCSSNCSSYGACACN